MAAKEHKERIDKAGEHHPGVSWIFTQWVSSAFAGNSVELVFFVFFAFSRGYSNCGI